jgi:hypothetical protein
MKCRSDGPVWIPAARIMKARGACPAAYGVKNGHYLEIP